MDPNHDQPDPPFDVEPEVPEALRRRLSDLYQTDLRVPGRVDDAVNAAFARQARRRLALRWAGPVAAAAAISIGVWAVWPSASPTGISEIGPGRTTAHDLDTDGRVSVLDALVLARRIENGDTGDDLTGDGRVDDADVRVIALAAVDLDRGAWR